MVENLHGAAKTGNGGRGPRSPAKPRRRGKQEAVFTAIIMLPQAQTGFAAGKWA